MREKRHAAMMHAGGLQPEDTYMHGADVAAGGFQPENEPEIQSDGGLQPERGLQPPVEHSPSSNAIIKKQMVPNCSVKIAARGFVVGQVGDHFFVAAEVECENFGVKGYMNIWHGCGDGEGPGTLYCALEYQPQFRFNCLCGGCRAGWFEQGWVCPLLEMADQGWVEDVGSDDSMEISEI
jgi:hypothetical protein